MSPGSAPLEDDELLDEAADELPLDDALLEDMLLEDVLLEDDPAP